jgi:DNA primase
MDEDEKPNILLAYDYYGIEVLGRDVGGWRKASCPLPEHEDTNPSASVNEEACRWRCHTCDKGGDIYDLIMERENLAGLFAAKQFAARVFGEGDSEVRGERGGSSLLPRRSGNRKRSGVRAAPWTRL